VPNFVSVAISVVELALEEKLHTQSINHSPSLFDAPGTEAFASDYTQYTHKILVKTNRLPLKMHR